MKELNNFVNKLTKTELDTVVYMYNAPGRQYPEKKKKLLDLILEEGIDNDDEACTRLYGIDYCTAFSHLKKSLLDDLLNVFFLKKSNKIYKYPSPFKARFECEKMMLQSRILTKKDCDALAMKKLKKALIIAEKHELFHLSIEIKTELMRKGGLVNGMMDFEEYSEGLESDAESLKYLALAEKNYCKLSFPGLYKKNKRENFEKFGKSVLKKFDKIPDDLEKNHRITLMELLSKIYYNSTTKNWEEYLVNSQKMLDFAENSPAVNTMTNYAGANMNMANAYINLHKYADAVKHAERAADNFRGGSRNELIAMDMLFLSQFYCDKMEEALVTADKAIGHKLFNKISVELSAQWHYYKACTLFKMGEYDNAETSLIKAQKLLKDKSGWLIGYKVLEMMINIEKDNFYHLSYILDQFNHSLYRNKPNGYPRFKAMFMIIRNFLRYGGKFDKCYLKSKALFQKLQNEEKGYKWEPTEIEIIRFDEWYKKKLKPETIKIFNELS